MRFAIIDCGTNTFHLLIADCNKRGYRFIYKMQKVVKLGEGMSSNYIQQIPFQRGLGALKSFRTQTDKYRPGIIRCYATSAIREAKNGNKFIDEAKSRFGFSIKTISGSREAELIYKGVRLALRKSMRTSLIMDIGGGSVEFIIFRDDDLLWKRSFRCGAAYLNQILKLSDPPSERETGEVRKYLDELLAPLFKACRRYQPVSLIGSAGSFETFAQMAESGKNRKAIDRKEYVFSMAEYHRLHSRLITSTLRQRLNMKGLVKMRADMIVMASLLLTFVLEKTGINEMRMSRFSLKEGILSELMNEHC